MLIRIPNLFLIQISVTVISLNPCGDVITPHIALNSEQWSKNESGQMGNLSCYYAEDRRFYSLFGWLRATQHYVCKNRSQRAGDCNPLLKVAALSL